MTDRKEQPVVPGVGARINRCTFPQPSGMARHYPRPTGMARCFPSSAEWPNVSPAQRHGQTFPRPTGMARRFPSPVAWPDVSPTSRRRAGRVERQDKQTHHVSLSDTSLQTLLQLVTPLKGYTPYLRAAVHRRCRRPRKGLGTKTVEATKRPSKRVRPG